MTNYHAMAMAARHAGRRNLHPSIMSVVATQRSHHALGSASLLSSSNSTTEVASMQISTMGTAQRMGSTASILGNPANNSSSSDGRSSFAALATMATSLAVAASYTASSSPITYCESNETKNQSTATGLADESEEDGSGVTNITIQDGMDTGSSTKTSSKSSLDNGSLGPADETEDNNNSNEEDDDDDDADKDEETTCSICLINRQGPCRKFWLKFERCMKEHSAEKDRIEKEKADVGAASEEEVVVAEEVDESTGGGNDEQETEGTVGSNNDEGEDQESLEAGWDAFMEKTTRPGEDDDDDDDDDDEDDDEDEGDDEEGDESTTDSDDNESATPEKEQDTEPSLGERCDKFMIPWIGCIQEHRNVYSLISNAFYQTDYIDPLEDTIPDSRRMCYAKNCNASIGEVHGYVMKFTGVEIDLGNWREHVEADADVGNGNGDDDENFEEGPVTPIASGSAEEPHLINAYAKFSLVDPSNGQPIEVAYIKDQRGRLLGFDSFTKRAAENKDEDGIHQGDADDVMAGKEQAGVSLDGECTFHIVPGETTGIVAYAIYRGEKKEEGGTREDFLYQTPEVPLPGVHNQKK